MPEALELLKEGKHKELWHKCCSFIDLDMEGFMAIQRRLLEEQIRLLGECELGRKIMREGVPWSVEEFREVVPLTTYADYAPYLLEQREDVLPEKPLYWQRTSGRSGEYPFKWVPITKRLCSEQGDLFLAVLIFATCQDRGDIAFEEHDRILWGLAPAPYPSGFWSRSLAEENIFDFLPPLDEAEKMAFQERIQRGFELALTGGLDIFFGIASVLVAVGEQFGGQADFKRLLPLLSRPKSLLRLGRAFLRSKLARRPLLPRDIWTLKAVAAGGGDAAVYREKVKNMWGRYPLETYGSTEANGVVALQTWDYQAMTFVPHLNFLEFIPESERAKSAMEPSYRPRTLFLDEVRPGETYEIVLTNFLGGAFVRYRVGDLIRITSLRNESLGIDIPQMVFYSRADGLIDLAGFARLTENVIWQAIENSGIPYQDWTVRKEVRDKPILHLYMELKGGAAFSQGQVLRAVHEELKRLDSDYADIENVLGYRALEVTVLPTGSFARYMARQEAAGADLAHVKPPHLNSTDAIVGSLLEPAGTR